MTTYTATIKATGYTLRTEIEADCLDVATAIARELADTRGELISVEAA